MDRTQQFIDRSVLKEVSCGSLVAFEKLYLAFHQKVYSYSFYFTKNNDDSLEIVQEIFVKLWAKRSQLTDVENPEKWLKTVTRNHCISFLKKRAILKQKEWESTIGTADWVLDTESILGRKELQEHLNRAMVQLTPQQRKIFELAKIHGMKRNLISEALNLSPATVSAHLGQSIKIVKKYLHEHVSLVFLLFLINL